MLWELWQYLITQTARVSIIAYGHCHCKRHTAITQHGINLIDFMLTVLYINNINARYLVL